MTKLFLAIVISLIFLNDFSHAMTRKDCESKGGRFKSRLIKGGLCFCYNLKLEDEGLSCNTFLENRLFELSRPAGKEHKFYRWGGPHERNLLDRQGFKLDSINHARLTFGKGLYVAEDLVSSSYYAEEGGYLVELTVPSTMRMLDFTDPQVVERLKEWGIWDENAEIIKNLNPPLMVRYMNDSEKKWWAIKDDKTPIGYKKFDPASLPYDMRSEIEEDLESNTARMIFNQQDSSRASMPKSGQAVQICPPTIQEENGHGTAKGLAENILGVMKWLLIGD